MSTATGTDRAPSIAATGLASHSDRALRLLRRLTLHRVALAGVSVLASILNFAGLGREGYANTYYAAAVKSMLQSWHNFFFVAFDPGGFVAVDKPPLGLWIQAVSAKVFGFSGVSMLAPQGIAALLSVLVLYALVARSFGRGAGLLAALALALTPVAVVDNRNNTSDSVLILFLLMSAWAVGRAVETGKLRWLLAGAVAMGLAFNVKEMEAYLVLPPLIVLYLAGCEAGIVRRLRDLVLFLIVTLIVSFSWIVAVDLTPASQRPFVSDSGTNSELSLALGYNGFGQLATGLLSRLPSIPLLHVKVDGTIVPGISMDIGAPGLLRLLRPAIGSQASWLLVVALVGLGIALLRPDSRLAPRRERAILLFWGAWLLAAGAFFSVARFYHLYYLIMLAPPVAALSGIGITRLWDDYRSSLQDAHPGWHGWALPVTVLVAGGAEGHVLSGYSAWNAWLGPAIEVACAAVAAVLICGRLGIRLVFAPDAILRFDTRTTLLASIAGIAALLTPSAAFAAQSVANGNGATWLPQAGPSTGFGGGRPGGFRQFGPPGGFGGPGGAPPNGGAPPTGGSSRPNTLGGPSGGSGSIPYLPQGEAGKASLGSARSPFRNARGFGGGGFGGGVLTFAGPDTPALDAGLVRYLERHRGHARFLVATPTSSYASLFILQTGQPVMALGGYQGWDKILTLSELKARVANGTIRYFLANGSGSAAGSGGVMPGGVDAGLNAVNQPLMSWIVSTCKAVPARAYSTSSQRGTSTSPRSSAAGFGAREPGQLYDCGSAR